jgi:hypothetical protein
MRIERVDPDTASPGDLIEIHGENFGSPQGKAVIIWRVVDHRPIRYIMRVSRWSDNLIRARIPGSLPPDTYGVYISRDARPLLSSNHGRVTIPDPNRRPGDARYRADDQYERAAIADRPAPRGGMLIQSVVPDEARPGQLLDIRGANFGSRPQGKIVAINLGRVNRMQVVSWSNEVIRARVPRTLMPGNYRVLVYYDDSFRTSSNSLPVTIER